MNRFPTLEDLEVGGVSVSNELYMDIRRLPEKARPSRPGLARSSVSLEPISATCGAAQGQPGRPWPQSGAWLGRV